MQKKTKTIILINLIIVLFAILFILLMQKKTSKVSQVNDQFAKATVYTKIGEQDIDITSLIETNPMPEISAGMIPLKQDGENWTITDKNDNTWYNYSNGKPAYMMLNDGVYQSEEYYQMPSSKKLVQNNIGTQISVNDADTLGSIYMWVPRFAYSEDDEGKVENIIYIKNGGIVAGSYIMPEIFTYTIGGTEILLPGMWVEINSLENESAVTTKVTDMNKEDSIYSFLAHTKANAMTLEEQTEIKKYIGSIFANAGDGTIGYKQISDIENINHTTIKILEKSEPEPIKAVATYDEINAKIEIEITYNKNSIAQIISKEELNIDYTSQDKTTANTGDELIGNGVYRFYVLDSEGNIKEIILKVTSSNVYNIYDVETLQLFRDAVNGGKTGAIGYQTADIEIKSTDTGVYPWTPIGYATGSKYTGTYYGNNHSISGIYVNSSNASYGFINYLSGSVKDLNLMDINKIGTGGFGSIANETYGDVTIENCSVSGTLLGGSIGGIVCDVSFGSKLTIKNCSFTGEISGANCGGMISKCYSSNIDINIDNCYNLANITGTTYAAGLIGHIQKMNSLIIDKCYNEGNIASTNYSGGLVGNIDQINGSTIEITQSYNLGEISGTSIAGIIAKIQYVSNMNIENCYNTGNLICDTTGSNTTFGIGRYYRVLFCI